MARGYMGKILNVNLTNGKIEEEPLDEGLCRDYIGGYGLAAKLLYERIPVGANPLGPNNILGLLTGPLTGTPAIGVIPSLQQELARLCMKNRRRMVAVEDPSRCFQGSIGLRRCR